MMSILFPTPKISHLNNDHYDNVYEPAEDSFLLLDALQDDLKFLQRLNPLVCLEVGCGSGIVITFLSKMLGNKACYICTDTNSEATSASKETGTVNGVDLEPILTDLVSGLLPRMKGIVDVLLFNPPYVVTPSEEVGGRGLAAAWAGGCQGREVTNRFLPLVTQLLSPDGVLYLMTIDENKPQEIRQLMSSSGFSSEVIAMRRTGPEKLSVLKFIRIPIRN